MLPVHAAPGASKNRVAGEHDGSLRVAVAAIADRGKANQELTEFLAEVLGVTRAAVKLVSGVKGRRKGFCIAGASAQQVAKSLRALGISCGLK